MRALRSVALVLGTAGAAAAQPVAGELVDGEGRRWAPTAGADVFTRADGARIELAPASLPCAQQLRIREAPRPAWLSGTYWPVAEVAGPTMILCIESLRGPVTVAARPADGAQLDERDLAAPLARVAALVSPPAVTASFPTIFSPLPVVRVEGDDLFVHVADRGEVRVRLTAVAGGACADELAAARPVGVPSPEALAEGYHPTVVRSETAASGCLDTAAGHVQVTITPGAAEPALGPLFDEIRRAAGERYGRARVEPARAVTAAHAAVPRGARPSRPRAGERPVAMASLYGGVVTFAPAGAERTFGGLVGGHYRGGRADRVGMGSMVDAELGFGDGELLGEFRVGVGLTASAGPIIFQLLGGGGLGSTGPSAAVDVFGEAGLIIPAGRSMTALSVMRAIGVGGLDHDRVQLWFAPPGAALAGVDDDDRSQVSFMLGARYLDFPEGGGDAFLFTFGFGLSTPPVP